MRKAGDQMNKYRDSVNATPNLPKAFFDACGQEPQAPMLASKQDAQWRVLRRCEVMEEVSRLAALLHSLGIKPGDRVIIAAEGRPEWVIADLAIMLLGAIVVPAYTTNTIADHVYIMEHSGASLAITSGGKLAEQVIDAACAASMGMVMVMQDEGKIADSVRIIPWMQGDSTQATLSQTDTEKLLNAIAPDDTCCLIYTSGTGGNPKGVMLTHASIQANIDAIVELIAEIGMTERHRFLSILPLSHAYEHTAGLHLPVQMGAEIWYCEGAEQIASNLIEASPTLMTAVPRLYEVLYDRIMRGVEAKGGISLRLFNLAIRLGTARLEGRLGIMGRLVDLVLSFLVRRKVRARLGGRLTFFVSGGAPLNPDIGRFFLALGVGILQGYGQTEASPLISVNRPSKIKIATVGPPVKGVEVQFSDDGEILARGKMLMKGYWCDEAATAETIRDGWLHTGDLGAIDEDGYITITGRRKDIIVNSGGDNIAPERVESLLTLQPEIEQAMVAGDKKPWLGAVIVPAQQGADTQGADTQGTQEAVAAGVARANQQLSKIEHVRRFIIADEPFSIDNSQMTATLKIRRHKINQVYADRLAALYRQK